MLRFIYQSGSIKLREIVQYPLIVVEAAALWLKVHFLLETLKLMFNLTALFVWRF